MKHVSARVLMALFAIFALTLAACGTTTTTATAATSDEAADETESMSDSDDDGHGEDGHGNDHHAGGDADHGDDGAGHAHDHSSVIDVPAGMAVPEIDLEVFPDPGGGNTLHVKLANFTIAPESASTDPVDGEGHLHLYVDGERQMRFYNEWIQLRLEEGDHVVEVEVSSNNHSAYAVDGEPIRASIDVTAEAGDGHSHSHGHGHDDEGHEGMNMDAMEDGDAMDTDATNSDATVQLSVTQDPKSGWNVHAVPTNFTFSPENVSTDPVDGEGHMHLSVNGAQIARLYGEWWHIPALPSGDVEIAVGLFGNDHSALMTDGAPISATTTVTVEDTTVMDEAMAEDEFIKIVLADGVVTVAEGRYSFDRDEIVNILFESDVDEEVHVHGYDLHLVAMAGESVAMGFPATIPGIFEIELENSGTFITELQVG